MSEEDSEITALSIQELRRRLDSQSLAVNDGAPSTAVAAASTAAPRSTFETFVDWLTRADGWQPTLPFDHVYPRKVERSSRSGLACLEIPEVGRRIYDLWDLYTQETPGPDGQQSEWPRGTSFKGCIDFLPARAPTVAQFCEFVQAGLSSRKVCQHLPNNEHALMRRSRCHSLRDASGL